MKSIVQLIFEENSQNSLLETSDLEEAAMSISDATKNNLAFFTKQEYDVTFLILYSPQKVNVGLSTTKVRPKHLSGWATKIKNAIVGFMSIEKGKVNRVVTVAAEKGYGPLMYEIASNLYGMITSDQDVKPAAEAIWRKFYERQDVKKKFLKTKEAPNKGDWGMDVRPYPPKEDPLMYGYIIPKKGSVSKLIKNHQSFSSFTDRNFDLSIDDLESVLGYLGQQYFLKRYDK